MNKTLIAAILISTGAAISTVIQSHAAAPEKKMVNAARLFLASLDEEQKTRAIVPFDSEKRTEWYYIPRERYGLTWKQMNEKQREAGIALLKSGLSSKGLQKVETIRKLEVVLKEIEAGSGPVRDPEMYYFAVFGTPDDKGTWGWRFEGHHISLHWTYMKGRVIATTPQFLGSNPAEVRVESPMKGTRVLGKEEDLGFRLLHSLKAAQKSECLYDPKAPADVLSTNVRQAAILADRGVAFGSLDPNQKRMLMDIIHEVAEVQAPEQAKERIDRLTKAGLETIKFAWMGAEQPGVGHYYRVQGKTFLIEFDNTQNGANHVHLVWRDFQGDFGRDLLGDHYKTASLDHGHNEALHR